MLHIGHPAAVLIAIAILFGGVIVIPFLKSQPVRPTPSKLLAAAIVVGACLFSWTLFPLIILLWPLSFIWFAEYWASYTGHIHGPYIDQASPPVVIAAFGWLFLVLFPLFVLWISNQ